MGIGAAIVGTSVVGSVLGSRAQKKAAQSASRAQQQSAEMSIEEQRRQFEEMKTMMAPFLEAGYGAIEGLSPFRQAGAEAFEQQQALLGLKGAAAQQQAISALETSPMYQEQVRAGEEALLSRASATGGLRGGNVQAALAQFRPQMLAQEIERQYGRLGGLAGAGAELETMIYGKGQAAAGLQAQQGANMAANVGNLLQSQGAARAGQALAQGQAMQSLYNIPSQALGMAYGLGMIGGAPSTPAPITTGVPVYTAGG